MENKPRSNVANSILCRFDRRSSSRTPGAALELAACRGSPVAVLHLSQRYRYLHVSTALVYLVCGVQSTESPGECHHQHQTLLLHGYGSKILASYFRYFRSFTAAAPVVNNTNMLSGHQMPNSGKFSYTIFSPRNLTISPIVKCSWTQQ